MSQELTQTEQPKHPGGRPAFYTDPDVLQTKIDEYFRHCDKGELVSHVNKKGEVVTIIQKIPYTVAGLALYLGFCSISSLDDYEQRNNEFSGIITRAKMRIHENRLLNGLTGRQDSKIVSLDLMCNYGYNPKQIVEHQHEVNVTQIQLVGQIRDLLGRATPEQLEELGVVDVVPELLEAPTTDNDTISD